MNLYWEPIIIEEFKGKTCTIITEDSIEFNVDVNTIRYSKLINEIIHNDYDLKEKISVNVPSSIFKHILSFLEYYVQENHKLYIFKKPTPSNLM